MNLNKAQPKNETEDLLPMFENCKMLINQTHTRAQETLEFKLTKSRETFSIEPLVNLGVDSNWMIGSTSLELYNCIFNITEYNNKFELYTDTFDEFSFLEIKDELVEILDISKITSEHLQDDKIEPRINSRFRKLETEKRQLTVITCF